MLFYKTLHGLLSLELLLLGMSDVYYARVKHLSRFVNNCHLASRSVARVETERTLALYRRLEQELAEIDIEYLESGFNSVVGHHVAYFALYRREYQPVIGICGGVTHGIGAGGAAVAQNAGIDYIQSFYAVNLYADLQKALVFSPVDGKNAVSRYFVYRLVIFVIHRIDALFFAVRGARLEHTRNSKQ